MPAGIRQPRIGLDKIGRTAELISQEDGAATIIFPRGRSHAATEGDENSLIDAGYLCINRLNWYGETPLEKDLLETAARAQG